MRRSEEMGRRRRSARRASWLASTAVVCCVVALASSTAFAQEGPSLAGLQLADGRDQPSPVTGPLAISGAPFGEAEAVQVARRAERLDPIVVAEQQSSQTRYQHLGVARASELAREAFPAVTAGPASSSANLPPGSRIVRYVSQYAAQLALTDGERGVVESASPIAREASDGRFVPVDLRLAATPGFYAPAGAAVSVRIPKRLADAVTMPEDGISLTPIGASGAPLQGAEGSEDGASVFFANTQADSDTIVKPTASGFEADTLLRSIASPDRLRFRLGLPDGADLVQSGGSGPARVIDRGVEIASVLPPSAEDAAGTAVPVTMRVSPGNVVSLTVAAAGGDYRYPILVDPTVADTTFTNFGGFEGNWGFYTDNPRGFGSTGVCSPQCRESAIDGGYELAAGQFAFLEYQTQGLSHIYAFNGTERTENADSRRASVRLENPAGETEGNEVVLPQSGAAEIGYQLPARTETSVCPAGCTPESVTASNAHNAAFLEAYAVESGSGEISTLLESANIGIEQEAGPVAELDTADAGVAGMTNALHPGVWVSLAHADQYTIGIQAYDPGVGVKSETLQSPGSPSWGVSARQSAGCWGVQCTECHDLGSFCASEVPGSEPLLSRLPELGTLTDGEHTVDASVEDGVGLKATAQPATLKVDSTAPSQITVSGLPGSNEVAEGVHSFTMEATDGTGSTASSGVRSIAVTIDGNEIGSPSGACSPGPCTANREQEIDGSELAAGAHVVTVTATDNAGNTASEHFSFNVVHSATIPFVTGVAPASGATAGGTSVAITGENFAGTTAVRFGASDATNAKVESPTLITATAPAGAGTVAVTVTNATGTSSLGAADQFFYGPAVSGIAPTAGPAEGGTVVTITGSGLTGATAVKFGQNSATSFSVTSDTSLTAVAPAGPTGAVDITVVAVGGTSATSAGDRFSYQPPTVTGLEPRIGPAEGGTVVTVTGTDFTHTTAVRFGASDASSFKVESPTALTAVAPPNALVASPRGESVDVTVISDGGTSAANGADRFFYNATAEPWAIAGSARVAALGAGLREAELGAASRTADEAAAASARGSAAAAKARSEEEAAFAAEISRQEGAEAARLRQEQAAAALGETPQKAAAAKSTKPPTRAQKLAKALKACAKESKRQRDRCERLARRQYRPTTTAKKSGSRRPAAEPAGARGRALRS
jgi:hypothetical protein